MPLSRSPPPNFRLHLRRNSTKRNPCQDPVQPPRNNSYTDNSTASGATKDTREKYLVTSKPMTHPSTRAHDQREIPVLSRDHGDFKPFIFPLATGTMPQGPGAMESHINTPSSTSSFPPSVLEAAASLSIGARFKYLLTHTRFLVQHHGPYLINEHTQHLTCTSRRQPQLSPVRFADSLAAAQDSLSVTQPEGPIFEDLKIFVLLWDTTTRLLETIIDSHNLSLESFGWGAMGLAAGFIEADELVSSHKQRLHTALTSLPTLTERTSAIQIGTAPDGRTHSLGSATRTTHTYAKLLVEEMRKDWSRIRWAHVVLVVERWVGHLGLGTEEGRAEEDGGSGGGGGGGSDDERRTEKPKRPDTLQRSRSSD